MKSKLHPFSFLFLLLCAFFVMSSPSFAGITFNQTQVKIVFAPTCNHIPISIPYIPAEASFDESLITVSSYSAWAIPSVNNSLDRIEITFATEDLIASYTATISVDDGEKVTELFIHATVPPLDIYRLLDDPLRSKTYGIQRNGIYNGSIIAFDPVQESLISCITVGNRPTDFVINDDSTELLVINSVGKTIDVIDLETFSLKETINLPVYNAWGVAGDTTANIDLGPDDIIYYIDGSWGPVLHVLKRSTGEILQSIIFDGSSPSNNTGFMDFAVTSDKTRMVAMPQYGWSAGAHSPVIGQYTINENGTVNFVKKTSLSNFIREPFEAPVLMRADDQIAVMKTIATDPANTDNLDRTFSSAIWSMNPNGSVVATGDKLYEYDTGIELYTIPGGSISGSGYTYTKAQAFTSDFTRFVYFNSSARTLNVVNLIDEIGLELLGRSLTPEDGSVVNSPDTLTWAPLSGVDQYDLYLGNDYDSIAAADHASPFYLGRVTGTSFALPQTLIDGVDYFWRIDPVTLLGPETGAVYTFTVSDIGLDVNKIDAQTIAGHSDYQVDIQLGSEEPGVSWTASAADSWVTFTESVGSTPSTLSVHLDSTMLSTGFHNSSITLTTGAGQLQIPVQLEVEPLHVTHIRSDRNSAKAYAISEDTSSAISKAYLLEIDSAAEKIQRVIPVGSSVTDLTIHYADNLIYVTNWKSGNLLVIDKNTFEHTKSIAFNPAGATGYSEGDVYRVAAGVSERLVVEEEDQWIDISIINTRTEAVLNQAFVREGGGAFDPTGRYYYHGENNSSGAAIIKYDTSGDIFTRLAGVRPPEISSYYGSRTVVVSEDGSRIFWSGVVLNSNLETEWGLGDIVYSTTDDGRYAFCNTAIYDVNLRRQVFTMPVRTNVSGYNSTSNKLITQVGDELKFYPITTPSSFPAPIVSVGNPSRNSIDLSWTDESLEMEFVLQQRVLGSSTWTDIQTTTANVTNSIAVGLLEATTYEFRVRASSPGFSSPWSNIAIGTTDVNDDHDGDGWADILDNCPDSYNPDQRDDDADHIGNSCDSDDDNDGLPDHYEWSLGLNPLNPGDATEDLDGDGFSNLIEFIKGSDPADQFSVPPPVYNVIIDFENGIMPDYLSKSPLTNNGWMIDHNVGASGSAKSMRAMPISHNQTAGIQWTDFFVSGTLEFDVLVDSKSCCDYLEMYVDGVYVSDWRSNTNWVHYSLNLSRGLHTLEWRYQKDDSVNSGIDTVWIDNVNYSAEPLDFFGMAVGNKWKYLGFNSNSQPFTSERNITSIDESSFAASVYVMDFTEKGLYAGTEFYNREGDQLKWWGTRYNDGGELVTAKFSDGLLTAWESLEVGDHEYSTATLTYDQYPGYIFDVALSVDVIDLEIVTLYFDAFQAYKVRNTISISGYGLSQTSTFYWWVVPYIGVIKTDADTTGLLTSFSIGGGVITETSDADNDSLADYLELFIYDTSWQIADTDDDGMPDGSDGCSTDSQKTAPGICGCNVADLDTDLDGVADCIDNCPMDANPNQSDMDGDGAGDICDLGKDNDGLPAAIEDGAPNSGDGNNDKTPDSDQDNVASLLSAAGDSYITVDTITAGGGSDLAGVSVIDAAQLPVDSDYDLPYGLVGFTVVNPANPGFSETVRIYFHGVADLSGYVYRKFDPNTSTWYTLPDVFFGVEVIGGQPVAYADLPLTDGGNGDSDLLANGSIVDPGGPALVKTSIHVIPQISAAVSTDTDRVVMFDASQSSCYAMVGSVSEGRVCAYEWNLGGPGKIVGGQGDSIVVFQYDTAGDYTATLTLTETGSQEQGTASVTVRAADVEPQVPVADFATAVSGREVTLSAPALPVEVTRAYIYWGDRTRTLATNPHTDLSGGITHTYTLGGRSYNIRIMTIDGAYNKVHYNYSEDSDLSVTLP